MDKSIIIIGSAVTSLGVIRGLRELGKEIFVISDRKDALTLHSKDIKETYIISNEQNPYLDSVRNIISLRGLQKPLILIAGNDKALIELSKNIKVLNEIAISTFPGWEIIQKIINKEMCNQIAESLNIPSIKTQEINSSEDLNDFIENVSNDFFPVFIKSSYSVDFLNLFGAKGIICYSRQELIGIYKRYNHKNIGGPLLIQEYLSGDIDQLVAVLLVLNKDSKVIAVSMNKKIRALEAYGPTTLSSSVWIQNLINDAIKLTEFLGLIGPVGVQFKWDEKDCLFKFMEINARFSTSVSLSQRCGINLAAITYKEFTIGNIIPPEIFKQNYKNKILLWFPLTDLKLLFKMRFWRRPHKYIFPLLGRGYVVEPFSVKDIFLPLRIIFHDIKKSIFRRKEL